MKQDLLEIINHYGLMKQLKYFQSEVFELNEAIIKKEIDYGSSDTTISMDKDNLKHIAEEIADVQVMLDQFQHYYGIEDKEIQEIMKYKINRQLERIEKGE